MTSASENVNRLSESDREAYRKAITETVDGWNYGRGATVYVPTSSDVLALERIGAHAIGCSLDDLRDSERDELTSFARETLYPTTEAK